MPMLEVNKKRLNELLGERLDDNEVYEVLFKIGMELDDVTDDEYKIEITPDRVDMLSPHGLVRALKNYLGLELPREYRTAGESGWKVSVDPSVLDVRPYIGNFIVKGIDVDEDVIKEIIYVQEKLHATLCRKRSVASIGIYPAEKIVPPLTYLAMRPEDIRFIPLGETVEMTADEILSKHPTGIEYGKLLSNKNKYPILMDSKREILSMPPIINSEVCGRVTEDTRTMFVDVTGTREVTVKHTLNILACLFIDMGGDVYSVDIERGDSITTTPDLVYRRMDIDTKDVNRVLGTELNRDEVNRLLTRMGYLIRDDGVYVEPYRIDVLHPIDIIDDVGRAVTYDSLEPTVTPVFTIGRLPPTERMIDRIREIMIGLKFVETFTMGLTSSKEQFDKMNVQSADHVTINRAKAKDVDMVRYWLLPEILKTLQVNKDRPYPIKMFELSDVVIPANTTTPSELPFVNRKHLSFVISDDNVGFTEAKQVIDYIFRLLGIDYLMKGVDHPSFIPGRCAKVMITDGKKGTDVGMVGEIHPEVLGRFDVQTPTVGAEIDIEKVMTEFLSKG
ncbi:phenylalanine--tRNA ligase subunit beta [Candidatus Micrarchaeota archaeon]|nr:phenylalanine--tRNA ligase subunit beta [Candidatus Micrarchaeota archaeon]